MRSFHEWASLQEASAAAGLFSYLQTIRAKPNADDLRTLVSMAAKNPQAGGLMADLMPGIDEVLGKLPADEADGIRDMLGRLEIDHSHTNRMMARGWHPQTGGPWQFASSRVLEDFLHQYMSGERAFAPDVVKTVVNANKDLFAELGEEFAQEFRRWFVDEVQKLRKQPTFSDMIRHALHNPEESGD